MPSIIYNDFTGQLKFVLLREGEYIIGRHSKCDIIIHNNTISRKHALLIVYANKTIIKDLQSTHGVLINNHPIETKLLVENDEIRLGNIIASFSYKNDIPSNVIVVDIKTRDKIISQQEDIEINQKRTPIPLNIEETQVSYLEESNTISIDEISDEEAIEISEVNFQQFPLESFVENILQSDEDTIENEENKITSKEHSKLLFITPEQTTEQKRKERIYEVLLDFSRYIGGSLELDDLLNKILDALGIMEIHRGAIVLKEKNGTLVTKLQKVYLKDVNLPPFRISTTIVNKVTNEKVALISSDARKDDRFVAGMSIVSQHIRSVMCAPLIGKESVLGAIYVDNISDTGRFDKENLEFLKLFCGQAAVAIENAQLHKEALEKKRLEHDIALARKIQNALLPQSTPEQENFEFAASYHASREVSGDYYDFLELDDDKLIIAIADVSGKGIPAALVMSNLQATLDTLSSFDLPLVELAERLNKLIKAHTPTGKFITAILGILDLKTASFQYVNAGHNPFFIIRHSGILEEFPPDGIALGIIGTAKYNIGEIQLEKGDAVFLYTDGLNEAIDIYREEYDLDMLREVLKQTVGTGAKNLHKLVLDDLTNFIKGAPLADDITMVAFSYN